MAIMDELRKHAVRAYRSGGMIRGPGTGTSDSIAATKPPGTFIMPADSTKAIGPKVLEEMGEPNNGPAEEQGEVPVQLSNGEYEFPPDQVMSLGAAVLRVMKDATHQPVSQGKGLANGGQVRGFRPQHLDDGDLVQQQQSDSAALKSVWGGVKDANANAGNAIMDVATMVPRGLAGAYDSAVVRPMRAVGINAGYLSPHLVPDGVDPSSMTPFTDQKRMAQAAAQPTVQAASVDSGPANPTDQRLSAGTQTAPSTIAGALSQQNPQPASSVSPGIQRIDQPGQSPLFTDNKDPTISGFMARQAGGPNAQNMGAADTMAARGFSPGSVAPTSIPQALGFRSPTVQNSSNNWQSANDLRNARVSASSIMNNGGSWDQHKGISPERADYMAQLATDQALKQAQPGMDQATMRENAGLQREGMQQQGANVRDANRTNLLGQELGLKREAQGFQTRASARLEELQNAYSAEQDPTKRASIAQQLQVLRGNGDQWKGVVMQGGTDAMGNKTESVLGAVNERTGEMKKFGGDAANAAPVVRTPEDLAKLAKGTKFMDDQGQMRVKN